MIARQKTRFNIAQIGSLDRPAVQNALGLAQLIQDAFDFDLHPSGIDAPEDRFRLQNGTYDLDRAIIEITAIAALPKPLILFTSLPYGDNETGNELDHAYFSDTSFRNGGALVSTSLWDPGRNAGGLQPYILFKLSHAMLSYLIGLKSHHESRNCQFDCRDDVEQIYRVLEGPGLCQQCEHHVVKQLRAGAITNYQIAAATKLFDRAKGQRRWFFITPLARKFHKIHETVARAVSSAGWLIVRADEIAQPRRITDAIFQALLASDLVVADVTDKNPNVFYELGFAHAAGCDVVMLCQESSRPLPFDVVQERALF